MKVHYSKSVPILGHFFDEVIAPNLTKSLGKEKAVPKIIVYALGLAVKQQQILDYAKAFADKDGMLDVDLLKDTVASSLDKWSDGTCYIPIIEWKADKADLEVLYKLAEKEAE